MDPLQFSSKLTLNDDKIMYESSNVNMAYFNTMTNLFKERSETDNWGHKEETRFHFQMYDIMVAYLKEREFPTILSAHKEYIFKLVSLSNEDNPEISTTCIYFGPKTRKGNEKVCLLQGSKKNYTVDYALNESYAIYCGQLNWYGEKSGYGYQQYTSGATYKGLFDDGDLSNGTLNFKNYCYRGNFGIKQYNGILYPCFEGDGIFYDGVQILVGWFKESKCVKSVSLL